MTLESFKGFGSGGEPVRSDETEPSVVAHASL